MGATFFPVDACNPRLAHLGIFTFIPDQLRHVASILIKCWQEDWELAMRQVLSAYCNKFTAFLGWGDDVS